MNKIIYAIVSVAGNGGQTMDSYLKEESAINRSKEIIEHIKNNKREGYKVYLSELEYDSYNNRILSDSLIDDESILLFQY